MGLRGPTTGPFGAGKWIFRDLKTRNSDSPTQKLGDRSPFGALNHFLLRRIREKHVFGCILAGRLEIPKKKGLGAPIFGPFCHIAFESPEPGPLPLGRSRPQVLRFSLLLATEFIIICLLGGEDNFFAGSPLKRRS